jgi:hypothetical protein
MGTWMKNLNIRKIIKRKKILNYIIQRAAIGRDFILDVGSSTGIFQHHISQCLGKEL